MVLVQRCLRWKILGIVIDFWDRLSCGYVGICCHCRGYVGVFGMCFGYDCMGNGHFL
jgi:hypothetical protein